MPRNWTPSQETAMNTRGKMLLVSAAAGSGKTSVLTERIIRTLTDREHPADLSRILVVTFTRAAAAELKSRIAKALSEALAQDPGNQRLTCQLFLLGSAQISTIDSFLQQTVRANFEQLGIPASFRIAEPNEMLPVAMEILDGCIREAYRKYDVSEKDGISDSVFSVLRQNCFADAIGHLRYTGKDEELDQFLLKLEDQQFASRPEGAQLLRQFAEELERDAERDFLLSRPGAVLRLQLKERFRSYLDVLSTYRAYLDTDPEADACFSGTLAADTAFCQGVLEALDAGGYEDVRKAVFAFAATRFPTMRGKPAKIDQYHAFREKIKDEINKQMKEDLLRRGSAELADEMRKTAGICRMLYELLSEFEKRFFEEKKHRAVFEFNDISRLLYPLLCTPDGNPTPFARSISEQYDAVYIDEYQDVNELQDRIFAAIGGDRRFMVGDIKQSIYGFRGSEPSIFAEYRRKMPAHGMPGAETATGNSIFMSENFRCNRPVIHFANRVCSFLFSACKDSVGYCPSDDLVFSKNVPEGVEQAPVQLVLLEKKPTKKKSEPVEEKDVPAASSKEREAEWIAVEVARLLREEQLDDGSPIRPEHIAVLVRDKNKLPDVKKTFERHGIPVSIPAFSDTARTPLMKDLVNLLSTVDNPYRDLALSEYLLTPMGGFSLEELTAIRTSVPDCKSLYDAMTAASVPGSPDYSPKAAEFCAWLEEWRQIASVQPADRFLRLLYLDARLSEISASSEALLLYEQARLYQRSSWCGLYGFLDHFTKQLESGSEISANGLKKAESAVLVTTMHQSKGLEFPVVFVAFCGAEFSKKALEGSRLFHRRVGFVSMLYDPETGNFDSPSLMNIVRQECKRDNNEENIRVLYVALTRARERLYVTGTLAKVSLDAEIADAQKVPRDSRYAILNENSFLRWILAAKEDITKKNEEFPCTLRYFPYEEPSDEAECETQETPGPILPQPQNADETTIRFREILERQNGFSYPLDALRGIPTKAAASRLRPDLLDLLKAGDDNTEAIAAQIDLMRSAPAFDRLLDDHRRPDAAAIGTATHAFLEFCDLTALPSRGIDAEAERLVAGQYLSAESAGIIHRSQLETFRQSDLMRQIVSAKRIYREQKFNLLLPLSALTSCESLKTELRGQTLFVQGSIDLILETEDGKLLLFDYKTDHISDAERNNDALLLRDLTARHGNQLACYALAVRQLFGKDPDGIYLYSLPLGRSIRIEPDLSAFL